MLQQILDRQRAAHLRDGPPSAEKRIAWLTRCIDLLVDQRRQIEETLAADFGARSPPSPT